MRKFLPVLLLVMSLFSCVTQEKVERAELIAHAGGAIDGYVYTNSLEALERAVENGYRYIEFDLGFTSDSVLVAVHSWSDFNRMTGNANWGDSVPSYSHFTAQKIHGRYTPLTAGMINDYFVKNPGIYLVTDKISDPDILSSSFPQLKNRMVVEAFSYNDYKRLVKEEYYRVLYSCMAEDMGSALVKNLLLDKLFPGERIEWVALHTSGFYHPMFRLMDRYRRFKVALFTVDNYNDISPEQLERASMIYTNTLLPCTAPDNKEK